MGPDPIHGAVVDAVGRVHGLAGVRIADASVMPEIPSANTNLATIMVAERMASLMT
jgi:choline dehydrogenase